MIIATMISLSFFLIFSFQKYSEISQLEDTLLEKSKQQIILSQSVGDFLFNTGYGGFIHHFKNYVLRGDDIYLRKAKQTYQEADVSLSTIKFTAEEIGIHIPLEGMTSTLSEYRAKLDVAEKMIKEGYSPSQIDAVVQVPDAVAIQDLRLSIRKVARFIESERLLTVEALKQTRETFFFLIYLSSFLFLVCLGLIVLSFFHSRRQSLLRVSHAQDAEKLRFAYQAERIGKIGHWYSDVQTNRIWWSEGVFSIHERARDLGMPTQREIRDSFHPEDKEDVERVIRKSFAEMKPFKFKKRLQFKDGRVKIVEVSGEPVQLDTMYTMFGVIQDVTSQEEVTEHLKSLYSRFELARKSVRMGIWDINLQTRMMTWDDEMHQLFDISVEEFHGNLNDWVSRIHPEDLEATRPFFIKAIEQGEEFEVRYRVILSDGQERWVDSRSHVIRDGQGVPVRILGLSLDITRMMEDADRLEKALQDANQANEAKSEFLAIMSHEIRTPLSGLIGILQILEEHQLNAEDRRLVETALSSSNHLLTVLSDILELSRIEAGKLEIVPTSFNLNKMLDQILALHESAARQKRLSLRLLKPNSELHCLGDEQRIRQILGNFISNAIKFTASGEVMVACKTKTDKDLREVLCSFSVVDEGIGIPEEKLSTLFQPFEQVDSSRTRRYGGSGLGLSICKKLSEAMGGTVDVISTEGYGSTFSFEIILPIAEEIENEAIQSQILLPKLNILAAEDVELNQFLLRILLGEKLGQEVKIVGNGAMAIQALENEEFDVVLMDIQMPEMDGLTATKLIRTSGNKYKKIPIIGLTANALKSQQEEYKAAGMNACISKPVDWKELADILSSLFCLPDEIIDVATIGNVDDVTQTAAFETQDALQNIRGLFGHEQFSIVIGDVIELFKKCLLEIEKEPGNPKVLKEKVHLMKGVAGNYGLTSLLQHVNQLEKLTGSESDLLEEINILREILEGLNA